MTETLEYYVVDSQNNRKAVLDSAGTVKEHISYDNWGQSFSPNASFTGKEMDSTGLYYFNARYYDPTVGRFLTEDPGKQGNSWYTYCSNNPLNRFDPNGKQDLATLLRVTREAEMAVTGLGPETGFDVAKIGEGAFKLELGALSIAALALDKGLSALTNIGHKEQINLTFGVYGMNVDTTGGLIPFTQGLNKAESMIGSEFVWQMLDPLRIIDNSSADPINTLNKTHNDMLFILDFLFWTNKATRIAVNLDGYDAATLDAIINGAKKTYIPLDPFTFGLLGPQGTLNDGLNMGSPYLKSITDWEIFMIYSIPELRKKATFYINSKDGSLTVKDVKRIMPELGFFQNPPLSPYYRPGLSASMRPEALKLPN